MQLIKHFLYAIAFVLALPINIPIWLFYLLPMKRQNSFEDVWWDWDGWCFHWDLDNESELFKEMSTGNWWGFVLGCNIIYVDYFPKREADRKKVHHEKRHVWQNYVLNILFYPLYKLMSGFIWLFLKDLHAYYDNPLEVDARRYAGQKIKIPREEWANGPHDRWPWW